MKRYKLLKDLPFAKAGDIFELHRGGINDHITLFKDNKQIYQFKVGENVSEMFDEWFEEAPGPKEYYHLSYAGAIIEREYIPSVELKGNIIAEEQLIENLKAIGNYFETEEEAEKYLEYLKAKEVIKQDTEGFKPDWNIVDGKKYYGVWDFEENKPDWRIAYTIKGVDIYFKSRKDILESFEKHPKEWKTYLTYEQ
ncbi:MAG: hypothetical protein Q4A23_00050 [bacterium]|nr:hypothetical protein [bacterium]